MWLSDGTVRVDGKLLKEWEIEQYRSEGSTRTRARTRGGAQIRAKDFRLRAVETVIHFQLREVCKKV